MKLCKDCKHMEVHYERGPECWSPNNKQPDYALGGTVRRYHAAQACRLDNTACGTTAQWFEPRP